jgi:solute carrier family 13 (sodium-dependent dicarboxylate transporter), member 2/3/5
MSTASMSTASMSTAAVAPAQEAHFEATNPTLVAVGQVLCVVVPLLVWFLPLGIEPAIQHAFAIVSFMVVAWITQALEFALAGIIGCFLFWALKVVKFDTAFSGFADSTAWFLFAALMFGRIATKSGLARRIAYSIMQHVGITYPRILLGLICTDFLLTFLVPSGIARVVIMASIALALVEAFHSPRGSNVSRGMFLILTYTGNIFDKMILAGAGSITAAGAMMKFGGVNVEYGQWLLAFLPCSIVTVFVAWRLTLWLFPPEHATLAGGRDFFRAELAKMGPWSPIEIKAAALLGLAIVLWVTDFLHHQSPVLIALGVTLLALLPRIGVLDVEDMIHLNYMPVFFVATAVSMGNVLEATKGLEPLTNAVFSWMTPFLTGPFSTTFVLYWVAFLYHFLLASEISMLGTSIPLVMEFAKAHAMSPLMLGLIWTFAAGGKLFAYQSGVLIVGYSYGYFTATDLMRVGLWLTIVEFLVLALIVPFYWPLIGIQ